MWLWLFLGVNPLVLFTGGGVFGLVGRKRKYVSLFRVALFTLLSSSTLDEKTLGTIGFNYQEMLLRRIADKLVSTTKHY